MVARVVQSAVLIVLTALTLTGCGRPASRESSRNLDLLATGPDRKVLPMMRPGVSAAIDAAGGLAAWKQCKRIEAGAVVTACARDGCFYLTEQDFVLCPWSDAIQVTAHEPRADFVWQVVGGQCHPPQADSNLDVSPLGGLSCDYADAVLQIATAPVRMLEEGVVLTPRPATVQIAGQRYLPIDAKYRVQTTGSKEKGSSKGASGPHWTQGICFQNADNSQVDMIWLGDPVAQKFVMVRGYDYAESASGVRIPTKIELFQSDPEANIGPRLALIDLKR
jgi:hypothetical protein